MRPASAKPEIRRATVDDLDALAELAARTFRETFEAVNEPADMDAYVERWFSRPRLAVELDDSLSAFFLAFVAPVAGPVGYAKLYAGEPEPSVTGELPVALERLYVGREALGRGVGAALMKGCLEAAARDGRRTLWLGVWERNERAIAFYERWGFETVGEHIFLLGADPQTDLIMQRAV